MIEDDIVRYAQRFAALAPFAARHRLRTRLRAPGGAPAPRAPGRGRPRPWSSAMNTLIDSLRRDMPSIARGRRGPARPAELAEQLEARNTQVVDELETTAKSLGFGIRAVQGGMQTFPILHGKPVSPEQFDVLDESTKRALGRGRGAAHDGGRALGAAREAARAPLRGRPRGGVRPRRVGAHRDDDEGASSTPSSRTAGRRSPTSSASRPALVDDWEDLLQGESNEERGRRTPNARRPRARDAPEPLPREPLRHERARTRRRRSSTRRTRRTRTSSATWSAGRASARCSPTSRACAPGRCTRRRAACSSCARPTC